MKFEENDVKIAQIHQELKVLETNLINAYKKSSDQPFINSELSSNLLSHKNFITLNSSLEGITRKSLTEVKSYQQPPQVIVQVFNCICVLKDKKEGWDNAKKDLNSPMAFIDSLKNIDIRQIKEKQIQRIKALGIETETEQEVKNKSLAASIVFRYLLIVVQIWNQQKTLILFEQKKTKLINDLKNKKKNVSKNERNSAKKRSLSKIQRENEVYEEFDPFKFSFKVADSNDQVILDDNFDKL